MVNFPAIDSYFSHYFPIFSAINSFYISGNLCRLLIAFANSEDPDLNRQKVGPDLDTNCVTLIVFLKDFFEKVDFEKIQ